jgi:hypothetical protein
VNSLTIEQSKCIIDCLQIVYSQLYIDKSIAITSETAISEKNIRHCLFMLTDDEKYLGVFEDEN